MQQQSVRCTRNARVHSSTLVLEVKKESGAESFQLSSLYDGNASEWHCLYPLELCLRRWGSACTLLGADHSRLVCCVCDLLFVHFYVCLPVYLSVGCVFVRLFVGLDVFLFRLNNLS